MQETIGHYTIERKLGEGGMGEVYLAHDQRLERRVAIKVMRAMGEEARQRFLREARVAAGINHPNICQIHALGEDHSRPYIVMELLEGESLGDRMARGRIPESEAVPIALGMLAGLQAMHQRELIHRDLKPSNVFLTPHGAKLLDFGLARPFVTPSDLDGLTAADLTVPGAIMGTPRYMAPEQLLGQTSSAVSDLFAVGAILFEMLSGKKAFAGDSITAILHAVLYEAPPELTEAPAFDRVVRRALARSAEDRYPSVQEMAEALRQARGAPAVTTPQRRQTRLIVLPLRVLRPDPETDFLAFSLPDAITASLAGLDSLVVRSSLAASRFAGPALDLEAIAKTAEVDVVLTGSVMRAGDQIRVSAQLVEAPGGTVVWTQTAQITLRDIFQLQDEIVSRIVEALSVPLTTREQRILKHDVPASAAAYEFYLRANRASQEYNQLAVARDLYLRCVELDPRYAPAWARLGRCHWLCAKWLTSAEEDMAKAEQAFQKAFELNPDLPVAHTMYARLEGDMGRAQQAMVRLIERAQMSPNDPELFSGLVHTCRYCGLLEASVAAHQRATSLDPQVITGVDYSYFMLGDLDRVLALRGVSFLHTRGLALSLLGRDAEALELLRRWEADLSGGILRLFAVAGRAMLEGKREESVAATEQLLALKYLDFEGRYFLCRQLARMGVQKRALEVFVETVDRGYRCVPGMVRDPWIDSLRGTPEFESSFKRAELGYEEARNAFRKAGGEAVLNCKV